MITKAPSFSNPIKDNAYLPFIAFFVLGLFGYTLRSVNYFSAVPGDLGDARFNSVILEHIYKWVIGQEEYLWSPSFFFPFEDVLAFSDNHFGTSVIYILLRLIGISRELAFDGWFLAGNCLNFIAAYICIRRLGIHSFGSAAGAFVFAFALPVLPKEVHAQLVYRFAIPLAFAAFWELLSERRFYPFWRVAFWSTVQFYCSIYLGVFLVYLLIATFIAFIALGKGKGLFHSCWVSLRNESKGAKALFYVVPVICMCMVMWLLFQYQSVSSDYGFVRHRGEVASMLPRFMSYFLADRAALSSWVGRLVNGIPMRHEHQMFFGVGVWVLCFWGAMSAWRGRLQEELGKVSILSALLLFVLTLSIGGLSLYLLFIYLPGVSSIRAVSRIVLAMMLPIGVLVAIGTEQLSRSVKNASLSWKFVMVVAILVLLGVEVLAYNPSNTPINQWIARQNSLRERLPAQIPANPIVFVTKKESEPFYMAELDGMILAQDMGVATLNGYSGNLPPGYMEPIPCYSPLNRLNAYALFRKLPIATMEPIADRLITIAAVAPCEHEPAIATANDIDSEQAKRISLNINEVRPENGTINAKLFVINSSSTDFNTLSLIGKPVRLSWRFVPISPSGEPLSQPGWDTRKDLAWTIVPGDHRETDISADLPKAPGSYLFEVSIVQDGVTWFHDLGMDIARVNVVVD